LGLSQSRVRHLIAAGKLPAEKYGRDWMLDEDAVMRFMELPRPTGRPRINPDRLVRPDHYKRTTKPKPKAEE
jgi:excisionase family DNA binding protein